MGSWVGVWCPRRSKEGISFSRARLAGSCELPELGTELRSSAIAVHTLNSRGPVSVLYTCLDKGNQQLPLIRTTVSVL